MPTVGHQVSYVELPSQGALIENLDLFLNGRRGPRYVSVSVLPSDPHCWVQHSTCGCRALYSWWHVFAGWLSEADEGEIQLSHRTVDEPPVLCQFAWPSGLHGNAIRIGFVVEADDDVFRAGVEEWLDNMKVRHQRIGGDEKCRPIATG